MSNLIGKTILAPVIPDPKKLKEARGVVPTEEDIELSENMELHELTVLDAYSNANSFWYLCESTSTSEVYNIHPSWVRKVNK